MTVENATWPDDLEPALPAATDLVNEGDDHMRLIKQVLQNWAGTTYGGQEIATSVAADIAALQAILQPQIDQNAADILTKADTDGAALTSVTIDGANPLTDANYADQPVVFTATAVMPGDSGRFLPTGSNVTLAGSPVDGNRLDVFNSGIGDITIDGGSFTGLGQAGSTQITVPSRYGVSLIRQGSVWYVIGTGSAA